MDAAVPEKENPSSDPQKLDEIGELVEQYARSRSLAVIIPQVVIVINAIVLIGVILLAHRYPGDWVLPAVWGSIAWVAVTSGLCVWLTIKFAKAFYAKEGEVEVPRKGTPWWGWAVFFAVFLVIVFTTGEDKMSVPLGLVALFVLMGGFNLWIARREQESVYLSISGWLDLGAAVLIAVELRPFKGQMWALSFFTTGTIYGTIIAAVAITASHIYNRKALRKLREAARGES